MALRMVDESKYLVSLYEIKYTYIHSKLEINITYGKYIDIVDIRNIYLYINFFFRSFKSRICFHLDLYICYI